MFYFKNTSKCLGEILLRQTFLHSSFRCAPLNANSSRLCSTSFRVFCIPYPNRLCFFLRLLLHLIENAFKSGFNLTSLMLEGASNVFCYHNLTAERQCDFGSGFASYMGHWENPPHEDRPSKQLLYILFRNCSWGLFRVFRRRCAYLHVYCHSNQTFQ